MPTPFVSKRAPIYADVPDEKWNDWRWQLSHRLNTAEEIEKVLPLNESERKALNTSGLFRVDITPYFISLIDPNDPEDPIRKQVIPVSEEMQSFTAMMEDSLAEDRHVLSLLHAFAYRWRSRSNVQSPRIRNADRISQADSTSPRCSPLRRRPACARPKNSGRIAKPPEGNPSY
jgi:hypothetical protein